MKTNPGENTSWPIHSDFKKQNKRKCPECEKGGRLLLRIEMR
jgi:hypothetical protein